MYDFINLLSKLMQLKMMDDGRPLSLPENDCTASNARRIGKQPAKAIRPSSKRVGRITLKRRTLAIVGKMVNSEDPFPNISDEILELILFKLPRLSFKAAKKVCKRWASVTSTPEFDILYKKRNPKSSLICFYMSREGPSESQCFAYDVESNACVTVPGLQLPPLNYDSLNGASGVVFAFTRPRRDRLLYKLTSSTSSAESFGEKWYETPAMRFSRWEPLVSVSLGAGMGHKVVVASGADFYTAGYKVVEVFDSEIGTWESYGDLPKEFLYYNCGWAMSRVILDNKFYAIPLHCKIGEFKIHFLDFSTKQWACIQLESPMGLTFSNIMAIGTTLVVAGIFKDNTRKQFAMKLWKVDLKTLSLIQIGLMPKTLAALIVRSYPICMPLVSYLVDENLVSISMQGWLFIVAKVSLEECKTYWRELPYLTRTNSLVPFWASISSA